MSLKLPAKMLVANSASATLPGTGSATVDRSALEAAFRTIIRWTGDDPNRDGLIETPARMARALDVVIKAVHHCMSARGVHKPGVELVTSRNDPATRQEFLRIAASPPAAQA